MGDKFTPGPWALHKYSSTTVQNEAGRTVASCGGYQDNMSDGAFAVENEANARLIAAAPELVEALRDMCAAAEYWAGCDEGVTPDAATSEIMSAGGAWPSVSYGNAHALLARIDGAAS